MHNRFSNPTSKTNLVSIYFEINWKMHKYLPPSYNCGEMRRSKLYTIVIEYLRYKFSNHQYEWWYYINLYEICLWFILLLRPFLSWINFFSYQTQYKKLENNFSTSQKGNIQSVMMRNFESNFNALIFRIPIPSQSSYAFFSFWKYVWLLFTLSSFGILLYVLLDLLFSWREKQNFKTWIIVKLYRKITAKGFL